MTTTIDPLLFPASHTPRSANSTRPRQVSQRTYRRRRAVVGASVAFVVAMATLATGAIASDPAYEDVSVPRTVVAKPGDTLWDIARTVVPEGAIGDLVTDMVRLNGSNIEPGQIIRIP